MAVKIFFCYAHEDEALLDKLKTHLRPLQRQGLIDVWHDRDISAGTEWERDISLHLNAAQIILLLVSPDFMNSDYCYGTEMKKALERHDQGEAHVIPIILRPVYWQGAPFGKLQVLPTDAKPILSASWYSLDEAFFNVVDGIQKLVENLLARDGWLADCQFHFQAGRYKEALSAAEQAIKLDPNYILSYDWKGQALYGLGRYQEALAIYEQAIRLNPDHFVAYQSREKVLRELRRQEEAVSLLPSQMRPLPHQTNTMSPRLKRPKPVTLPQAKLSSKTHPLIASWRIFVIGLIVVGILLLSTAGILALLRSFYSSGKPSSSISTSTSTSTVTPSSSPTPSSTATPDPGFSFCNTPCITNGFQVESPNGWVQTNPDATSIAFKDPQQIDAYAIFKTPGPTSVDALTLIKNDLNDNYAPNPGYIAPTTSSTSFIGGENWTYETASYQLNGAVVQIQVYSTVHQGKAFIIELEKPASIYDVDYNWFIQLMFNSFRFL